MANEKQPHSLVYWFRWETHPFNNRGEISGYSSSANEYAGALRCDNKEQAENIIEDIVNKLREELEKWNNLLS